MSVCVGIYGSMLVMEELSCVDMYIDGHVMMIIDSATGRRYYYS